MIIATIRKQIKDTKNELENIESVIGGTLKSLTTEVNELVNNNNNNKLHSARVLGNDTTITTTIIIQAIQ